VSIAICQGANGQDPPHCPLLLYAGGHGEDAPFNAVQATQGPEGYELDNFYVDGIKGVCDEDMVEAEVDESPCCACCTAEVHHWDHSPLETRA
jgi:hypothetical protein